jgi:ATP-dependent Clp protease ATP-binding subunit ClpA
VHPTAAFQRVVQRAVLHVESSSKDEVTGANVLVSIFAERDSHAAYFLQEQDMTRYDAVNYISARRRQEAGHVEVEARRRSGEKEDDATKPVARRWRILRRPQPEGARRQDRSTHRPPC